MVRVWCKPIEDRPRMRSEVSTSNGGPVRRQSGLALRIVAMHLPGLLHTRFSFLTMTRFRLR